MRIIHSDKGVGNGNYAPLLEDHDQSFSESVGLNEKEPLEIPPPRPRLPFRRIWTSNVILTMVSQAFFEFHLGYVT